MGMACYRAKVREVLVNPGYHRERELVRLDFFQIYGLVDARLRTKERRNANEPGETWEQVFWPMYEEGFQHQEHWHRRSEEALDSLMDWIGQLATSRRVIQTPFPYMQIDARQPTASDLLWMYLVVGIKLEECFGLKHVFVPDEAYMKLVGERTQLRWSVWGIVHGGASLRDFKAWWLHIQRDLRTAPGRSVSGPIAGNLGTPGAQDDHALPQTANPDPPSPRRRRRTRAENIACICGYLEKHPDATNAEIA